MSCCPNGLQKRLLKPEQSCWRSAPIRYTLAVREAALCPKRFLFFPANVYGYHKLEAEQRVLAITPGAILLRAAWMYDFPGYRLPIRGNLPLNLLSAAKTGTALHFSEQDFRGVSYVREVIDKLIPAMELARWCLQFWQWKRLRHV